MNLRKIAIAALVVALAGCESFDDDDPRKPAELVDFQATIEIDKMWSHNIGDQQEYLSPLRIVEDAGVVYAASIDGTVEAYNRNSGEVKWSIELEAPISGGVSASRGMVLVGTTEGEVIALSAVDGSERWRAQLRTEITAPPVSNGRQVVINSPEGIVYALSATDGSELWQYQDVLPALTSQGIAAPVMEGPIALVGFASGKLSALRADAGLPVWEALVAIPTGRSDIEKIVDVDGEPTVSGPSVFAATINGNIKAFDLRQGRVLWEAPASTSNALASGFSNVYLSELDGTVTAYRADTGAQVWRNEQLSYRGLSAPVVWSSYLAIGDRDGYVHVLSQVDGSFVARYKIGDTVRSLMASRGKSLYVLSDNGTVTALKIAD